MSTARERNSQNKIHIPTSARESQYLLAKFSITDQLLGKYADLIDHGSAQPYTAFYQHLADLFFNINESLALESGQFVANDKFTRVRFSSEKLTFQSKQQILFLYSPHYHRGENSYFDGSKLAKKVTLVFLANGDELRLKAAKFHRKVRQAVTIFADEAGIARHEIRINDHQHLAYDLFAKSKGVSGIQTHKLRTIANRYLADDVKLPDNKDALTYVIADIPVNRRIKGLAAIDNASVAPYQKLYSFLFDAFTRSAQRYDIGSGVFVANGMIPIVRRSHADEYIKQDGELLMIGYNPAHINGGFSQQWQGEQLIDTVQLVFLASDANKTPQGYGKFLNQVEQALHAMAEQLEYQTEKEEMIVRFHQHVGYLL